MPEGDVVWRTARRLDQAFRGAPLVGAELRWPSLGDRSLHGRTTIEVASRGKHLLHRLSGGLTLHSHLRMEGSWRLRRTSTMTRAAVGPRSIRALLATADWTAIGTSLGMLDLVATRDEDRLVGHLGPDLLGDDWDAQRAIQNLRAAPDRALGAALLDQRNLAGLGTIWTAEPLFAQRLDPWTPVGELPIETLQDLLDTARRMLTHAAHRERFDEEAAVHGRGGRACRRCGGTVQVAPIGEPPNDRVMFHCPTCQGVR
ncbi:DNA-formamidopyrimidine glycosylase family protein [Flexivirga meconopsidis]|uniref:DNA-formamidopyrimidine glycosylase family protein n=1 Tax=Flexivirga meconopsidis TaxID=2977121 RepID=UPI002240BF2F|nr:DNA-formamidopyrimidine glycosylase family protein [Flexivirga meconopsidis]